jgi:hypothetical protein
MAAISWCQKKTINIAALAALAQLLLSTSHNKLRGVDGRTLSFAAYQFFLASCKQPHPTPDCEAHLKYSGSTHPAMTLKRLLGNKIGHHTTPPRARH